VSSNRTYTSRVRTEAAGRTRDAILDAAEQLFGQQGYGATRLPQIAAEAGVVVNTIYSSIGGKRELIDAIVDRYVSHEVVLTALTDIDTATTTDHLLVLLVTGVRRSYEVTLRPARIVIDAAHTDPALQPALDRMTIPFRERLGRIADRCADLTVDRSLDRDVLAQVFWFYLGYSAWHEMGALGWSWETRERWTGRQLASAVADLPDALL
jgi:AcrR family transcriptional regulator